MRIRQQLHLDVAGPFETAFQIHAAITEGTRRLGLGAAHGIDQGGGVADDAHALATTTRDGLDHQRIANRSGDVDQGGETEVSCQRPIGAGNDRHTSAHRQATCFGLVAHQRNRFRRRTDEHQ